MVVKSPQTLVVPASVQVPHMETLGQSQPGGEVLGVTHRDEQDVASVTT